MHDPKLETLEWLERKRIYAELERHGRGDEAADLRYENWGRDADAAYEDWCSR